MSMSKIRSICARLVGLKYRELPFGTRREDIEAALAELDAHKCGESGTPAFEVNNEYFRIGRRKLRVCTEDDMFVSLWGARQLVDRVHARVTESWEARRQTGV
jgi:hypothetical protein